MFGMAPTHVQCNRCGTRTEIRPDETAAVTGCANCLDAGDDPSQVDPIAVLPCPSTTGCGDDAHDPATGLHIIEID